MHTRDLENLLAAHADGLNGGRDMSAAELLARQSEIASEVEPLLKLSGRVSRTMVRVEPRAVFVADLRARLGASRVIAPAASRSSQPTWVVLLAGLGGAISLVSLGVLVIRLAVSGARMMLEAFDRPGRMAPAKARVAH